MKSRMGIWLLLGWIGAAWGQDIALNIKNASFEEPIVDANAFQALPYVSDWIELDLDEQGSTNTGVFPNSPIQICIQNHRK